MGKWQGPRGGKGELEKTATPENLSQPGTPSPFVARMLPGPPIPFPLGYKQPLPLALIHSLTSPTLSICCVPGIPGRQQKVGSHSLYPPMRTHRVASDLPDTKIHNTEGVEGKRDAGVCLDGRSSTEPCHRNCRRELLQMV